MSLHVVLPTLPGLVLAVAACSAPMIAGQSVSDAPLAARIVDALQPDSGEYAVLRYDPGESAGLATVLELLLRERGVHGAQLPYGPVPDFHQYLERADIYVWLPTDDPSGTTPAQAALLEGWLDDGQGRQVHFHWGAGTVAADGLPGEHSAPYDAVYRNALRVDRRALDRRQDAAIALLRSGTVRVTTPNGTDLSFDVGDRPFNKQNGDASRDRMRSARIRIDREIELPPGVVRVAPSEESVSGVLIVPHARFPDGEAHHLRLVFRAGRVLDFSAASGRERFARALVGQPALAHFRELGIGFNPRLVAPPDSVWIPYYGYGAGVVRLSLGNNEELGGTVSGQGVRWFFITDATVRVGSTVLVEDGRLCIAALEHAELDGCTQE